MHSTQRKLEFAQQYPTKRAGLPFFAHKFIRYLYRRGVAAVLHRDALVLLTLIVLTEDQVRYSRPVGFWGSELTAMTGMTPARLAAVRQQCQERGWLSYCEGAKGVQGTYFVRVPGGDDLAMQDSPLGQDHDYALQMGMEQAAKEVARDKCQVSSGKEQVARGKESPSTSDIATDPQYADIIAQLKRCGVKGAASCISKALALVDLDHVQAVISYHDSRRLAGKDGPLWPYDPGLLVERLTNPDYAALAPAEGWSEKLLNKEWAVAEARRIELARLAKEREEREREQTAAAEAETARRVRAEQLELQFGELLDDLERRSPETLWRIVTEFNESFASWARKQPAGLRSPMVRSRLLSAAADGSLSFGTCSLPLATSSR